MDEMDDVDKHFLAKYGDRYVGERKALRVTLCILGNVVPVPRECVKDEQRPASPPAGERGLPAWVDPKLYAEAVETIGNLTNLKGDALHREALAAVQAWNLRLS